LYIDFSCVILKEAISLQGGMMKKLLAKLGTGALILATPAITSAQFVGQDFQNLRSYLSPLRPLNGNFDLISLATVILNFVILIAGILAIFYLIWAGIQYITASTDEEKAKKARAGIYNAVIGIVVIVLSYVIVQYVSQIAKNTAGSLNGNGSSLDGGLNGFIQP
jgi:hypothetical protein